MNRRAFLRSALACATVAALFPSAAMALYNSEGSGFEPATRTRGSTVRNARDYGLSESSSDNRAAIQRAIDSLPSSGGTVVIPAGRYRVGTVTNLGIRLRSNMLLLMDPETYLEARPNSATRNYILYVRGSNVEIAGGNLIGDRYQHSYSGSSTHEWGHGIQCAGDGRLTIRDLRVQDCTGDGICVGSHASDVHIARVVSTNNRRQGLSLTQCTDVKVYDSEFSYTNGTAPECGIDLEPDAENWCRRVEINNCWLHHNDKHGFYTYNRVSDALVTNCLVERNRSCGLVADARYSSNIDFIGNNVRYNSASGVALWRGSGDIRGNVFFANYTRNGTRDRNPDRVYTGYSSTFERDILRRGGSWTIGTNTYQ